MNIQKVKEGKEGLILSLVVFFVLAIAMGATVSDTASVLGRGIVVGLSALFSILLAYWIVGEIMKIVEGMHEESPK